MGKKNVFISMRDHIHDGIREMILNNSYLPDSTLNIDQLAEEFGVSTTPIREALVRLEGEGLVTLSPNRRVKVTAIHEEDVRHIWEMRRLLEPEAARQSAALTPDAEIDELARDVRELIAEAGDYNKYRDSDLRLHELLYVRLPNSILKQTLKRILQLSIRMRYFAEDVTLMRDQVVREVSREHLAILDALKQRDPEQAGEAVLQHVRNSERRTVDALRRRQET